jgi:hypothetical protein
VQEIGEEELAIYTAHNYFSREGQAKQLVQMHKKEIDTKF